MFIVGDVVRIKGLEETWKHLAGHIGVFIGDGELDKVSVQLIHGGLAMQFMSEELEYLCHINDLNHAMYKANRDKEKNASGNK